MKEALLNQAKELNQVIIEDRRYLHQHPELGLELPETVAYVKKQIKEIGLEPVDCGKGIIVDIGKGEGKTILLRGDMDALPAAEETELEFKATNGKGHLCGHDMHTAMLIGVARLLKKNEDKIQGKIRLMFQPAEETGQGAKNMIENGVLEGVDSAIGLHVMSNKKNGEVSMKFGPGCSGIDAFFVTVQGKGGHGSMPEDAVDPLYAVTIMNQMLNGIVSREVSMNDQAVLTVGELGGGQAANIIPDTAIINGTIRCFEDRVRERIIKRLENIVNGVSIACSVKSDLNIISNPSLLNDETLGKELKDYIIDLIGEENFTISTTPMAGSEDFSLVSRKVPTIYLWMGMGDLDYMPVHNPRVKFEEDYLYRGSAVLSYCALKWLENHK